MIMMGLLRFMLLVCILLVNMQTVSTWAMPAQEMKPATMDKMAGDDNDPCDTMQNFSDKKGDGSPRHCEGLCLCMHVSSFQSPIMDAPVTIPPVLMRLTYAIPHDRISSRSFLPLKRPPRIIA